MQRPPQPTWRDRPEWPLLVLYALLHTLLGWRLGIQHLTDTPRYLQLAQHLWQPSQWDGGDIWYWGYAALLRLTGAPAFPAGMIAIQLLAGASCLVLLVQTARRWGGVRTGWIAGLLFLAYVDYQAFHWKLLTDSLFTSLSTIVLLQACRNLNWGFVQTALPLVLLRPVGWVVVLTLSLAKILQLPLRQKWIVFGVVGLAGLALALILFRDYAIAPSWASGAVIQGYDGLTVPPPADLRQNPGLLGWLELLVQAPGYGLMLAAHRVFWFLAGIRPYYSLGHNVYLGFWGVLVYLLAGMGWRVVPASARTLLLGFLLLLTASVIIAAPDWDGRFFHPLVPLLCLVAALGAEVRLARRR